MELFVFGFFVVLLLWMRFEARYYEITRHTIRLPKALGSAFRILHLSDIHFAGPDSKLARFFDELAAEKPDLVLISGDVFDCTEGIPAAVENLKKLKPAYGKFAVFGNHDYYNYHLLDLVIHFLPGQGPPPEKQPVELFEKALQEAGIHLLRNETRSVPVGGTALFLHGLDDPTTGRANIRKALEGFQTGRPHFLLSHTIDAFLDIGEGEIDLAFSGHSHGGQIRLPGLGPLITHTLLGRAYASGIHSLKGAVCSVSRGMGSSRFFQFRLLCRPHAVFLEVKGK